MKKKFLLMLCAVSVFMTSCGKVSTGNTGCQCSSNGCSCCQCANQENQQVVIEDANKVLGLAPEQTDVKEDLTMSEGSTATITDIEIESTGEGILETQTIPDETIPSETVVEVKDVKDLTEGEKEARRQLLKQLDEQRMLLYALPNSIEKMEKIAKIEELMIQNRTYDFSEKNICFVGDSITEAVCGDIAEDGSRISYLNHMQTYMDIGEVMNRGRAGWMYSNYGTTEYSLAYNLDSVLYLFSDATVLFLGVNDYLVEAQDKRYGELDLNAVSTAGYCGAVRGTMKYLQKYYGEQDIFVVLGYNPGREVNSTYTDIEPAPTLADYLDVQRSYAESLGFHVIDIYSTGIMDLSVEEIKSTYTADGLHPNDKGNVILAKHIAAEMVLYYSTR